MRHVPSVIFPPFRLDLVNQRLWRDSRAIALTPKTFALLRHLLEHADQLVTKEELLGAVWPDTYVTDAVLKVCIGELRKALGDDATCPRFIETAHRRGYRFIGKITEEEERERQRDRETERQMAESLSVSPSLWRQQGKQAAARATCRHLWPVH